MNRIRKQFFMLILLIFLCIVGIPTFIQASDVIIQKDIEYGIANTVGKVVTSGDYQYFNLEDGTIMLEKYNGTEKKLVIPSKIDEKEITIIDGEAFKGNSSIVTVTFPDTVLYIDSYVFSDCENLTTVNVPDSVLKMYTLTNGCPKLQSFEVPSTLTKRDNTYVNLSTVTVDGTNNYNLAQDVVDLVNQEREKLGLSPLKLDLELCNAAMERAAETSIFWSHTRTDMTGSLTISSKADGENIGVGPASATIIMNSWMNSAGHKRQIVNEEYKTIGVGVFQTNGATYWVQTFSRDDIGEEVTKTGKEEVTKKIPVANGWGLFDLTISGIEENNTIKVGESMKPSSIKILNQASTLRYYTKIHPEDLIWQTSNDNVFTVDNQGNITGQGEGVATLTVSIGTFSETYTITVEGGLNGDINQDGIVNVNDVNYGMRGIVGKVTLTDLEEQIGDVNEDGIFNVNDINMIMRFIVGKINKL